MGRTEEIYFKVEGARELRLPIQASGSFTSATALKPYLLRRTSTDSSARLQSGSAELFSKPADMQRQLVQWERLTTTRSKESLQTAAAVARNPSESLTKISPTPDLGRYETATSLKNALVQHANMDQIPAAQVGQCMYFCLRKAARMTGKV